MPKEYISSSHQLPAPTDKTAYNVTNEFRGVNDFRQKNGTMFSEELFPKYSPNPFLDFMIMTALSPFYNYSEPRKVFYGTAPKVKISDNSVIQEQFLPKYLDLLNRSAERIGLSHEQINLALQVLSEGRSFKDLSEGQFGKDQLDLCAKLLRGIYTGEVPFMILVKAEPEDKMLEEPLSISLVPDPSQLNITQNKKRVGKVLSAQFYGVVNEDNLRYVVDTIQLSNKLLESFPTNRKDLEPHMVAIARTMHDETSLIKLFTIGCVYKNSLWQIRNGLVHTT